MRRRILFICEENRLRSPTAADLYNKNLELEVKSAGLGDNANVQVGKELLEWADQIFVMERIQRNKIHKKYPEIYSKKSIICLYIPDEYEFMDKSLVRILKTRLSPHIGFPVSE